MRHSFSRSNPAALAAPVALAAIAVGLGFAFHRLSSPGLYYDELLFVNAAVGGVTDLFVTTSIGGVPVLLMDYIGALKSWIHAPVFALFGLTTATVRVPSIVAGALGGMLLCATAWRRIDPWAGALTAALLFTNPAFIGHLHIDWGPTDFMFLLRGILVWCVLSWATAPASSGLPLVGAIAAMVLGTFDKLSFLWIDLAVVGAVAVVYHREALLFARSHRGIAAVLVLGLAWACAVVTVRAVSLTQGLQPFALGALERSRVVAGLLGRLATGDGVMQFVADAPASLGLLAAAGWVGLLGVATTAAPRLPRDVRARVVAFLVVTTLLELAALVSTPTATGPHHAALLLGLPEMIVSGVVVATWATASVGRRRATLASVTMVVVAGLVGNVEQARAFRCPSPPFDRANLEVARILAGREKDRIVNVDWGVGTLLVFASAGRLPFVDAQWLIRDWSPDRIVRQLVDPWRDTYFVTHLGEAESVRGNRARLLAALQEAALEPESVVRIPDCRGQPMVEVLLVPRRQYPPATTVGDAH